MTHTMRHRARTTLGLVTAAALLTLSACGGGSDSSGDSSGDSKDASSSASSSPSADAGSGAAADGEPDLTGIPDVVAEVNGEEVTKDEFVPLYVSAYQQAASQAQSTGQAPDEEALKKQTADDLVSTELLAQEAESRGIEVSDEQVDAELDNLATQNQLASADELLAAVEQRGISEEQARSQVRIQLMVEQLAADEDGSLEPTEKELHTLYDQAKAQAGQSDQKIPAFDKVHDQLAEEATTQKVSEVAGTLVTALRKDADITVNL